MSQPSVKTACRLGLEVEYNSRHNMVHVVGQFSLTYRRLHYHTSVAICRLIARTVLILDSSAINRLVIRVQRGSGGGAAAAPSCTRGNQLIAVWVLCVI